MKLQAVVAEILGTFFFLSIILVAVAESYGPIAIAAGLLAAIYFGGKISGGHFNPAVSIMMYVKGNINFVTTFAYIVSQIIGGLLALLMNSFLIL